MANHNLARSMAECGRLGEWRDSVYFGRRSDRQRTRLALQRAAIDEEVSDGLKKSSSREDIGWPDRYAHNSRVSLRWLESNVGRPWAEVKSKITRNYRGNKGKNWNLRDQMLYWVAESPHDIYRSHRFQIDENGILCNGREFDRPERCYHFRIAPPSSWPMNKGNTPDTSWFDSFRYGRDAEWSAINIAGEPHWVRACTWGEELNDKGQLIRYPILYRHVRPFTPEETTYLRNLSFYGYRKLFLSMRMANRKATNRYRRDGKGLSVLPEIKLID